MSLFKVLEMLGKDGPAIKISKPFFTCLTQGTSTLGM